MPMKLSSLLTNRQSAIKPAPLENVRIAAPCPASWEAMAGDDRVRFCSECKLNVYNLSDMTRREAERLIASHEGRLCVRFYRRADGTILTENCPRGLRLLIQRVSRVAGAALSAIMGLGFAVAQTPQNESCRQPTNQEPMHDGIYLVIAHGQGGVMAQATVTITDSSGKNRCVATSGSGQAITVSGLPPGVYKVRVDAQGFKTIERKLRVEKNKITMRTWKMKMGEPTTTITVGMVAEPAVSPPLSSTPLPMSSGAPAPARD